MQASQAGRSSLPFDYSEARGLEGGCVFLSHLIFSILFASAVRSQDTYGGWGAHGGGAFSGKDPTKVDRSAAYICRQMAKSVVNSGLSARCLVQLSYAIGVAKPLSLFVETYGSEKGNLTVDDITSVLKIEFDCRPGAIAQSLALREPKYQDTAAYCHFGREPATKGGIKFFEWENPKDLSKYKTMSTAQVEAALKASTYLTKWVD